MCISFEPTVNEKALTVRVSSAFLLEDAVQLGAAVAGAEPGTEVDVDFLQVREYQAPALARLADLLRSCHARVALRGITSHEVKLLGYLGAPSELLADQPGAVG